jgi:hypothetical protein
VQQQPLLDLLEELTSSLLQAYQPVVLIQGLTEPTLLLE